MLPILTLHIRLAHDAVYARQRAREIAERLGFDRNDQTRIATAVSEIARNAWQYARGGIVEFCYAPGDRPVFQITVRDEGPGIADPNAALEGELRNEAGGGSGKGISGSRSVMDSFVLDTGPDRVGTVVTMGKHLAPPSKEKDPAELAALARELESRAPQTPLEELHRQNQELLQTLSLIKTQQTDWERLYREMENTNRDMLAVHDELSSQNQALGLSETRFRRMVEEVKDYAIYLLNTDGEITTWNIGAERMLGYAENEILGCSSDLLFVPEERDDGVPEREREAARHGRTNDERQYLRRDGSRFWANSVVTVLGSDDNSNNSDNSDDSDGENPPRIIGYVKILQDITGQKQAQDALQTAFARERHITEILQKPLLQETAEDAFAGLSVATLYESALAEAEVGGDFFDSFALPSGRNGLPAPVVFAVGDASGKGLSASLRAMQVKELLRAAFALVDDPQPTRVVTRINQYLCDLSRESKGGEGFVTLALFVLTPETGAGCFVSAGCEPPLLVRAGGETETPWAAGLPLSVTPDTTYQAISFTLAPGDTLLLTTDGITEARNRNDFLGFEGMEALAREAACAGCSLPEMSRLIVEGARAFTDRGFRDDVCLLLVRRH